MRRRMMGYAALALLLLVLAQRHPSADIRVLTHDATDQSPQRIEAGIDLGVMAISLLVTWTRRLS